MKKVSVVDDDIEFLDYLCLLLRNAEDLTQHLLDLERDGVLERRPGRPLVVAQMDSADLELEKLDQLRSHLAGAVRATQQLGIKPGEAVRVFRRMLENKKED